MLHSWVPVNQFKSEVGLIPRHICGWPEKVSAPTIDGNNIGKMFFLKLIHVISIHVKLQDILSSCLFYTAVRSRSAVCIPLKCMKFSIVRL
jgi:hypothetical protein